MTTTIAILLLLNAAAFTVRAALGSGAAGSGTPSAMAERSADTASPRVTAPDTSAGLVSQRSGALSPGRPRCTSARKAVRYWRSQHASWARKMGARVSYSVTSLPPCPRYLARVAREKARAARKAYERWYAYHYDWQAWLPDKWQRIGACETGFGKRPGNWRHYNSGYAGAFGFAHSSWRAFVKYADPKAGPYPWMAHVATPRQQYEVALAIWRMYGFSGWGCRGA